MSIILDGLTKRYAGQPVVDRVCLEVAGGELFVLLGASGSGKSTILRLIAGLAQPDSGRIVLDGRDVTQLPPQRRGVGFVFQNYSIFRHMSVADNVEFGLKIRGVPVPERAHRREQLLDLVGLAGLGGRYAHQLSGGQQQRVAVARALAYEPSVLLLDEPFGALDVKIRGQLRRSLKEIQDRLGVTTILVTHDQEEAFELADRIGVIDRGRLLEVGAPEALYTRPASLFVATFLGAGTVLVGREESGYATFGPLRLPIPPETPHEAGARVQLFFRPEQVALSDDRPDGEAPVIGQGTIFEGNFGGALRRVRLRLPRLRATRQIAPPPPFGEEDLLIDAILPAETPLPKHELWLSLRGWHILRQAPSRLLVCDSGTGPTAHLSLAARLAAAMNADATVLGVADNPEEADSLRLELEQRQRQAGLSAMDTRVRHGDPVEQIVNEQAEAVYRLMVLAATDRPDARSERVGETATRVLEHAAIPTLVVRAESVGIDQVLICTAAGEPGKHDVRVGGRLARSLGASATLLYITRGLAQPSPLARSHLERAVATLRVLDVTSQVQIRPAPTPARGILAEVAAGSYDLVVVGGHGPQSRSIFGIDDVTLRLLAGTDRPVLVVPMDED